MSVADRLKRGQIVWTIQDGKVCKMRVESVAKNSLNAADDIYYFTCGYASMRRKELYLTSTALIRDIMAQCAELSKVNKCVPKIVQVRNNAKKV